ncbi:MAG TPA: rod shape-determining protein [Azospirillaceae bacterium]|nr:rod shape-determining protein [Azospirillaceae bacterium]
MPSLFPRPFSSASRDLAIDLGTANTLVYMKKRGIVLDEPSVVAVTDTRGHQDIFAVGLPAKQMVGRTPSGMRTVRPLRDGVIADFDLAAVMIRHFIERVRRSSRLSRPRIMVSVPTGATALERRSIREAAQSAGAREVLLIEEPVAAAIGAGLPVTGPHGVMVVDIGGGTTEVAVMALGGVVHGRSVRVAGDAMDDAIIAHVRRHHGLLIGQPMAERIKIEIGSAVPPVEGNGRTVPVTGRDIQNGVPRESGIHEREIVEALNDPVQHIVAAVKSVLEGTPPEIAADIVDRGMMLTGGGALLRKIDQKLNQATGLPVTVAEKPLECVVLGTGKALENLERFRSLPLDAA